MSRTTIGKYINLEKIGAGGMAEVFIGHDDSLDRKVAIKLILPHLATAGDFEERFRREAKTVAALRHNNIIQIYEYAIEEGNPYMVMEYLENGSLEEYLTDLRGKGQIMSLEEAASMLGKIASGLDYAHKRDLIHRDIKPSNILLSADGEPIIADFGIVKMLNESVVLTQTGGVVGSPRYLPPEQASNAPIDYRSDIYSLGIMLYEMTTGQVPFDGDLISIMMQHVNETPQNPSELNSDIPWAASSVITQALAKDPEERFASAGEMARAFKRAISVDPSTQPEFVKAAAPVSTPSANIMDAAPQPISASPAVTQAAVPTSGGISKPVLFGGIGLGVIALIVAGVMIFGGNGNTGNNNTAIVDNSAELTVEAAIAGTTEADADSASTVTDAPPEEPTLEPTLVPTATTAPPTATAFPEPWVQINSITIEGGYYVVDYETYGYVEALPGEHIHFFFDTVYPEYAGVPYNGPWKIYGGPRPFSDYSVGDTPAGATQLCALFANANHSVEQNSGNCYPLSAESTMDYVLEGEWDFFMYAVGSNSPYDLGTVTFSDDATGTYLLIDYYGYDNTGEFMITTDGFELPIRGWIGQFEDANTISGIWDNDDATGTFTATRK